MHNSLYAVTAVGGSQSDYYRCWRALRRQGRWPADVPLRPATLAESCAALRTAVYEVEMILPSLSVHTIEEVVLKSGGWLRRITLAKLPRRTRLDGYRAVWLISGLIDWEWLRKLAEVHYGRIQEVDEGQYHVVLR